MESILKMLPSLNLKRRIKITLASIIGIDYSNFQDAVVIICRDTEKQNQGVIFNKVFYRYYIELLNIYKV